MFANTRLWPAEPNWIVGIIHFFSRDFASFYLFPYLELPKVFRNRKTTESFVGPKRHTQVASNDLENGGEVTEYGKCLETGKRQNPLLWPKLSQTASTE